MDDELICNYRKCRKRLDSSFAWVTSCSHKDIFCDADGTREFSNSLVCPACDTTLSSKYDIIRLDIKPPEHFKLVALCGLKPDIIMEICSRAIAFWNYQCHQERTYQEYLANKAKERNTQLETYYENMISRLQQELTSTRKKVAQYDAKVKELNAKLGEKTRQYQKLQNLYEALRRRCVTPAYFKDDNEHRPVRLEGGYPQNFMMNFSCRDDVFGPPYIDNRSSTTKGLQRNDNDGNTPRRSTPQREFNFKPNITPISGNLGGHHRDILGNKTLI